MNPCYFFYSSSCHSICNFTINSFSSFVLLPPPRNEVSFPCLLCKDTAERAFPGLYRSIFPSTAYKYLLALQRFVNYQSDQVSYAKATNETHGKCRISFYTRYSCPLHTVQLRNAHYTCFSYMHVHVL